MDFILFLLLYLLNKDEIAMDLILLIFEQKMKKIEKIKKGEKDGKEEEKIIEGSNPSRLFCVSCIGDCVLLGVSYFDIHLNLYNFFFLIFLFNKHNFLFIL